MMATLSRSLVDRAASPVVTRDNQISPAKLLLRIASESSPADLKRFHRAVGAVSGVLARHVGFAAAQAEAIALAGSLHDIGMALLPPELYRPGRLLSINERIVAQRHCLWGQELLSLAGDDLDLAAAVAMQHHERWDGRGYPHGLRADEISLPARVVSVSAAYVKIRMSAQHASEPDGNPVFGRIDEDCGSGVDGAFDPAIVTAFLDCRDAIFIEAERSLRTDERRSSFPVGLISCELS